VQEVHSINLLEAPVLRLYEEEKDNGNESRAAAREDEAVEIIDGIRDETGTALLLEIDSSFL